MRGGARRVIFYRPDTGAAVDCGVTLAREGAPLGAELQYETTAAGTRRLQQVEHTLSVLVPRREQVEALQRWQTERILVRALVLGSPRGAHRIWDEPVRLEIEPADATFGELAGHVVRLYSARYDAAIELSDDLNALDPWADDDATKGLADGWRLATTSGTGLPTFVGAGPSAWQALTAGPGVGLVMWRDVVLPAPGLRARFSSILTGGVGGDEFLTLPTRDARVNLVLQAWRFGPRPAPAPPDPQGPPAPIPTAVLATTRKQITAEGGAYAWLTLPPHTYAVRMLVEIHGGTHGLGSVQVRRPRLLTRPEPAEAALNGGFLLNGEDATSVELWEYGVATVDEVLVSRTFRGVTYPVGIYTLGPDALLDVLATDGGADQPHTLFLDVTLPPE